jgi:hypothetical protein
MIELKFRLDDDLNEDHLKCIMAYRDYPCAIWSLKELVKNFWETSGAGKTEEEIDKFTKEFYKIINGLPELD